ncbi:hypothetical protein BOQ57_19290 [Aeromonas hydrophila]|nr:hypothetical protein BOQ57_19290 [Aeromonas hydrophila]RWT37467.1 hypothetical protein DN613_11850 [Aeromonas caviae]
MPALKLYLQRLHLVLICFNKKMKVWQPYLLSFIKVYFQCSIYWTCDSYFLEIPIELFFQLLRF